MKESFVANKLLLCCYCSL